MKKKDLKTGMYLLQRDEDETMVMLSTGDKIESLVVDKELSTANNSGEFRRHTNHFELSHWNEDLTSNYKDGHDIMQVRDRYGYILWTRKEEKVILEFDGVEYSESTLRSLIKKATS